MAPFNTGFLEIEQLSQSIREQMEKRRRVLSETAILTAEEEIALKASTEIIVAGEVSPNKHDAAAGSSSNNATKPEPLPRKSLGKALPAGSLMKTVSVPSVRVELVDDEEIPKMENSPETLRETSQQDQSAGGQRSTERSVPEGRPSPKKTSPVLVRIQSWLRFPNSHNNTISTNNHNHKTTHYKNIARRSSESSAIKPPQNHLQSRMQGKQDTSTVLANIRRSTPERSTPSKLTAPVAPGPHLGPMDRTPSAPRDIPVSTSTMAASSLPLNLSVKVSVLRDMFDPKKRMQAEAELRNGKLDTEQSGGLRRPHGDAPFKRTSCRLNASGIDRSSRRLSQILVKEWEQRIIEANETSYPNHSRP